MKMTLSQKILAGFIICATILLLVVYFSFHNSQRFIDSNKSVEHTHLVIYEFEQVLAASVDAESSTRGFLIAGDPAYIQTFTEARDRTWKHLNKVSQLTSDNPTQAKNIGLLRNRLEQRMDYHTELIEVYKNNRVTGEAMFATGDSRRLQEQVKATIQDAITTEYELLENRRSITSAEASRFNNTLVILVITIVLVLFGVHITIDNNLKALRKAEKESKDKNWLLTGSFELNEITRGEQDVHNLGQSIIEFICNYLNAKVGVIYIYQNEQLTCSGTYAFNGDRQHKNYIAPGEGLIGQAALEKKIIQFNDVPTGYLHIQSGLGEQSPQHITVIPLITDGIVKAVIEIGTSYPLTEAQMQFVELVNENIAIVISAAQSRNQLKDLLEETQRQGEELTAQQEELRQANEALEDSAGELRAQQEELQHSNHELQEKTALLELQKNQLESTKQALEEKAEELESAGQYKSEFLANMSHELRTPLNSILILSKILADNKKQTLTEREVELCKNIYHSGNDLLNLINEILDLSKVEAGKLELNVENILVADVAEQLNTTFTEVAAQKPIHFTIENSVKASTTISTDKQRLDQILKNLLSNAFKFTAAHGAVSLQIQVVTNTAQFKRASLVNSREALAFIVTDTGIGIPSKKLELVFQAFQQADGSNKRKYGGTGLGLSISKELANILGGEIKVSSEVGKGSIFTLYLPMHFDASFIEGTNKKIELSQQKKPANEEPFDQFQISQQFIKDDRSSVTHADKLILIVEDDLHFAGVLLEFVRGKKYKGLVTTDGTKVLQMARQYKPDAIILDLNLPVMNGREVLHQLKAAADLRHIPVQIISGYDYKDAETELGAINFLRKPVNAEDLQNAFERIEDFLRKKLKKLLIVEDNPQQSDAIRELIGNGEVKSVSAFSGKQAFEMMKAEHFDCVIMDLTLPDISGFELLEKIKADEQLKTVPVVVYTGKEISREEHMLLSKSADTVVLKTAASQERLLDETMLFLHRVESQLPREKLNSVKQLHRSDEILTNRKALLVDDDIRNIYALSNILEDEAMICLTAENGKQALEVLHHHPDISIVLMDVMMPEMDGYEATKAIRKMEQFRDLPIIAITAKAMKGDREKCLEAGMSDYISKPVNIDQLLSLIRVWIYA